MKASQALMIGSAAAAAALLAWRAAGAISAGSAEGLRYSTRCEFLAPHTVAGVVSNLSSDTYEVAGPTSFIFYATGSASPTGPFLVFGSGMILSGKKEIVATISTPLSVGRDNECQFSVADAIKKAEKPRR